MPCKSHQKVKDRDNTITTTTVITTTTIITFTMIIIYDDYDLKCLARATRR